MSERTRYTVRGTGPEGSQSNASALFLHEACALAVTLLDRGWAYVIIDESMDREVVC